MPGPLGEPVEAPSLVHACFSSLSAGSSPAVTSQPSAHRAKKSLRCHLLILSVYLLPLTRRASTGSSWPPRLPTGALDECILACRHAYPPSVTIVHPKEGKRFPIPLRCRATAFITCRGQAAFPGVTDTIRLLHRQGYALHTASGACSLELAGALEGMGVRRCFGRLYGADLINAFRVGTWPA
jgi:hypothetical protein